MEAESSSRRFVVYIGPPKTASSTLEAWLLRHAQGKNKADAFAEWDSPAFGTNGNGLLGLLKGKEEKVRKIRKTFRRYADSKRNIVVGTEGLVAFDGMLSGIFDNMTEWLQHRTSPPEIVIQYRSPRLSHLVSMWKQLTQVGGKTTRGWPFRKWMCETPFPFKYSLKNKLTTSANPLGLASKLVDPNGRYQLKTFLLDMGGVQHANMDICHAFACQVLRVNCTSSYQIYNGSSLVYGQQWVAGLPGATAHKNSRRGNPKLSAEESVALEEIFTQWDCAFYSDFVDNPLLTILYRHKLWDNNCSQVINNPEKLNEGMLFRNDVRTMLARMREVLSCPNNNHPSLVSGKVDNDPIGHIILPNKTTIKPVLVQGWKQGHQSSGRAIDQESGVFLIVWVTLLVVVVVGARRLRRLRRASTELLQ